MIRTIHLRGGAEDVRKAESRTAGQHVLSNAFLPGMFRDGGVRLCVRAPQGDAAGLSASDPTVICPGA